MFKPADWTKLHGRAFDGVGVMVTGGAGFIGSHLTEALVSLGANVSVLDDLSGGVRANLEPAQAQVARGQSPNTNQLRFIEGSILDTQALAEAVDGARFVFHQAALGSVPQSLEEPHAYQRVNIEGTLNVLQAATHAGVRRLMFAASSAAYGNEPTLPKLETMPIAPASPYAATKVAGEAWLAAWASSFALDTVALRYFNIFGPRQNANSAYAAVIAAFSAALAEHQRPTIFGDGEQTRDFTHVDNVVHGNLLAARARNPLHGRIINLASGRSITLNQLAHEMASLVGQADLTPHYTDSRPGDVRHSAADLNRADKLLGYQPIVQFEPGLADTLKALGYPR